MFASLPWASRKAARPRLLTWVPSGRENLLKKQEVGGLSHRYLKQPNVRSFKSNPRNRRNLWMNVSDGLVLRAGYLDDDVFLSELRYFSLLTLNLLLIVFRGISPATDQLNNPYLLAIAGKQLFVFASGT